MRNRHRIQFPPSDGRRLGQDEAYFYLEQQGERRTVRFHDYEEIYRVPGLYEQLFYDRLKCRSPAKVAQLLEAAVAQSSDLFSELRVLDLGAGNGMMGEALAERGVSRLVGVDILAAARDACARDRPGLYDAYYVADFCALDATLREELREWRCDCLTTVAALGFGDIPPRAFVTAFNLVRERGWVAFNLKETFFDATDRSGFSSLVRELLFSDYLKVYHLERYRHRLSLDGAPLYYYALAAHKQRDIPEDFLRRLER